MAYKYAKGKVFRGDIYNEDDSERNTYIDFGSDDYIGLVASGSSVLVVSGSKVGIGTATPDYTLDVAGNAGFDEYIYHNGDADTFIRFQDDEINIKAGDVNFISIAETTQNKIVFNDGAADVDFIVRSPSESKALYLNAANEVFHINHGDSGFKTKIHSTNGEAVTVNEFGVIINEEGHAVNDFRIESDTNTHMFFVDAGDNMVGINTSSPSEALTVVGDISGSGDLLLGGKIGLGNKQDVTPTAMLHISSSYLQANPLVQIESGDNGEDGAQLLIKGNMQPASQATATLIELNSNIDYRARGIHLTCDDGNEEWFAGVPYPGGRYQIGFDGTSGKPWRVLSSSLDILESGDVGIGTSGDTAAKLHVMDTGEIMRLGYDTSNYTSFNISSDGSVTVTSNQSTADLKLHPASILELGTQYTDDVYIGRTDTASDTIIYGGTSGAEVMRIDGSADSVGIGTATPGATLDIVGDTSSDQLRLGLGGTYYYKIGRNSSTGFLDFQGTQAGYTGYAFKNDDGSTDLTILDSGYVGIGTTSPASTFEVSGSQAGNYTQTAVSITFTETHYVVDYTGNGNATFTLPASSGVTGRQYHILSHAQGGGDKLTITGSGGAFQGTYLEGDATSVDIDGNTPQSITVLSTGTNWFILNDGRSDG